MEPENYLSASVRNIVELSVECGKSFLDTESTEIFAAMLKAATDELGHQPVSLTEWMVIADMGTDDIEEYL